MPIVFATGVGAVSLAWIFGALSGRLPSMLAALIEPSWIGVSTPAKTAPAGTTAVPATGGFTIPNNVLNPVNDAASAWNNLKHLLGGL